MDLNDIEDKENWTKNIFEEKILGVLPCMYHSRAYQQLVHDNNSHQPNIWL